MLIRTLLIAATALTLSACMNEPHMMESSALSPDKLRLIEGRHVVKKPISMMNETDIAQAAALHNRAGAGPVYVVIAYDDRGKGVDRRVAETQRGIVTSLQQDGVPARDIVTSSIPLETSEPVALIAFDTLQAAAPAGCTATPSLDGPPLRPEDFDYKVGCGVQDLFARQIANPKDLEGKAGLGGHNDGSRAANIVDAYRNEETPREYLPSYIISDLAGSGS